YGEITRMAPTTKLTKCGVNQCFRTQELGERYIIATSYGLSRIAEKDLDTLGLDKPKVEAKEKPAAKTNGEVSEEDVWNQLRQCFDPEIPVSIVELGLVGGG